MKTTLPDTPDLMAPSVWRRLASWTYEGILLFGVTFVAAYLFSALSQSRHALTHRTALMVFLFVVYAVYFTWMGSKGQTLAMKTWHLKWVDCKGLPLSQTRAFGRYLLSWVWFLPPLFVGQWLQLDVSASAAMMGGWIVLWALLSHFQAQKQFWHDAWSGAYVVSTQPNGR